MGYATMNTHATMKVKVYYWLMKHIDSSIIFFTSERLITLFIRESLFIVFTKERLFVLFKFTCAVYKS